jgi:ubiquinone/menaquinone biosynthesis C-methylase UbiE
MPSRSTPGPAPRPAIIGAAQARFWDRAARKYAADPIADPAGYETTLRRVQALLSIDQTVLEVGCGTGSTALRLAAGTRRMLATDVSAEMIAIAREKLAAQPLPQLRFGVADAQGAGAGNARHDVVLAFNVLHLLPDMDGALRATLSSLEPGGLFISKTPCLAELSPLVMRVFVPLMRSLGKAPAVLSFDAEQLQAALRRQGLEIEAVERHGSRRKDMRVFIAARKTW